LEKKTMKRTPWIGIAACVAVPIGCLILWGQSANAENPVRDSVAEVQKVIADSKLPADIKDSVAAAKNPTYGKIYYLWPMNNGTFLFGILTPSAGYAFTIKTGGLTADSMIKVLLLSYEKQTPVYVFADAANPQVATGVVTVNLPGS
jgi:hypothetical protein